ncbi:BEN domain-containing protein 6-like [Nerophis lumbriciformis]|uniref:BEN domain-containing protein 6-like n=1 Tax=Nerophis lumbriciformis TaxID=546530 RepID=UPI003BAD6747
MESLKKEVLQLREENKSLRDALRVVEELPGLLMKMDDLSRQATILSARRPAVALQIPTTSAIGQSVPSTLVQTTERLSQPPYPSTPTSHRSSPVPFRSPTVTPTQAHLRRVFDYEVDEDGQVDLGYGVAVNANNLQYVSRSDQKKTTYTVCEVVFTREELANSSLTGRKSNAFKDKHEKPKLDDKKVSAIIDFVKKLHPSSEANVIKKIIGVKLNIAQKMEKKKASETNSAGRLAVSNSRGSAIMLIYAADIYLLRQDLSYMYINTSQHSFNCNICLSPLPVLDHRFCPDYRKPWVTKGQRAEQTLPRGRDPL